MRITNTRRLGDNFYRLTSTVLPSENVVMDLAIDKIDGELLDTTVDLKGQFAIAGNTIEEFTNKLGALIDEYRI